MQQIDAARASYLRACQARRDKMVRLHRELGGTRAAKKLGVSRQYLGRVVKEEREKAQR